MRAREEAAVEAISAYLAHADGPLDPHALARTIGTAAGAAGCALIVADVRYEWGNAAGPWLEQPVFYGGELQGRLAVTPQSVGPLPAVATVLGAPLAAVGLAAETDRLRRAGDAAVLALTDDRWRATVELERERRALERDLHDGAQHHLVVLKMALALVEDAGAAARDRLARVLSTLDTAERVLVDTAAGVLPVALATDGLVAALSAELTGADDLVLDTSGVHQRYSPRAETAVYFACLEAVNNARKHAAGARITVTAHDTDLGLEFVVTDDGPGFANPVRNSGLDNLSTRLAAVGGTIEVRSAPGQGTTVTGFVPG